VKRVALSAVLFSLLLAVGTSQVAARGGGGGEARAAGVCGSGATSNLRLRRRAGDIEVRFEVEHARSGQRWHVTLVRERRVVFRGQARTQRGSFEVERRIPDFSGADKVSARAVSPSGLTCSAAATLPGR
jgi:hypothetical protein